MESKAMEKRNYLINAGKHVLLHAAKGMALAVAVVLLVSCGKKEGGSEADSLAESAGTGEEAVLDWQGQYDLGMRLLGEGNYEEAVIAFSAAIEIEPKRAAAYMARGDAYMAMGETASAEGSMENLASDAASDYGYAIELLIAWYGDGAIENTASAEQAWMFPENMTYSDAVSRMVELYRQLAADYAAKEDYEAAAEALRRAQELLDGCAAAEDGTGEMPGVDKALLEQLLEEIREQLQGYENPEDGSGAELNAYGAPVFQQRETYEDYETMSAERREMVDRLVEIALSGDVQGLERYLPKAETWDENKYKDIYTAEGVCRIRYEELYTAKGEYRIRIERDCLMPAERGPFPFGLLPHHMVSVEVRQENGAGYSCVFMGIGEEYIDECFAMVQTSGACKDWQWDGAVTITLHAAEGLREDGLVDWQEYDMVETGMMKEGLREGEFIGNGTNVISRHSEYLFGEGSDMDMPIFLMETYSSGILKGGTENGETDVLYDVNGLRVMKHEDAWNWEQIFW